GQWLDFIFDRIRIFLCVLALVVGQYLQTGHAWYLVLGMVAVFVECLRYINSAHSEKLRQWMRAQVTEAYRRARPDQDTADRHEPMPFIEDVLTANPDL